jgi:hypothetical protein
MAIAPGGPPRGTPAPAGRQLWLRLASFILLLLVWEGAAVILGSACCPDRARGGGHAARR